MIKGFEQTQVLEPEFRDRIQWTAAVAAGFIAGLVLLIVPHGSPWSSITFFSRIIMGRAQPVGVVLDLPVVWLIHLAISLIYAVIISLFLAHLTQARAILTGGLLGLVLYLLNFGIVTLVWPAWRGNELSVLFTHVVFGLIAGSAYRGLLRRKARSLRIAAK
jgi:hypothetical protein